MFQDALDLDPDEDLPLLESLRTLVGFRKLLVELQT